MDRVRFGRALGFGTRQAVKTIMTAVDAATADSPATAAPTPKPSPTRASAASAPITPKAADLVGTVFKAASQAHDVHRQAQHQVQREVHRVAKSGVRQGAAQFKESAWKPFVRLSGVLWLEVTGVFFGIFALFALAAVLRLRSAWHVTAANAAAHRSLLGAIAMLAVFGYFCVSSFVRAHRRERRR
jgi:hypothetical protein